MLLRGNHSVSMPEKAGLIDLSSADEDVMTGLIFQRINRRTGVGSGVERSINYRIEGAIAECILQVPGIAAIAKQALDFVREICRSNATVE